MLPRPSQVQVHDGTFILDEHTTLAVDPALAEVGHWWRATIGPATGCWWPAGPPGLSLELDLTLGPEAYTLDVTPAGVRLRGGDPAGVRYGLQTLRQLLPPAAFARARVQSDPWRIPCVTIEDRPRFAWRGCLLDVARHFMPKADVLRFIDLLAMHKLNVLHLHLTDDQGWRLPVPGWPRLTEVGAWRRESPIGHWRHQCPDGRPHGGFYLREELLEIVAYAADRSVTVVPEVDLPGHVQAAVAAYPELGRPEPVEVRTTWGISPHVLNLSDRALAFCRDVLDEVVSIFPSPFICIGGDECPTDEWKTGPAAQARLQVEGLSDVSDLQPWFTARMVEHLAGHGRKVLGWDELLGPAGRGAPTGVTIAAWRGPDATVAAARAGHDVVACPNSSVYLDYRQSTHPAEPIPVGSLLTLEDVYAFDPLPAELSPSEAARVIGVQACVWTEYMDSARSVDYLVFPRLCALAEVAWSGPGRTEADFAGRLRVHMGRLRAYGVEYRRDNGPQPWQTRPDARGWPR